MKIYRGKKRLAKKTIKAMGSDLKKLIWLNTLKPGDIVYTHTYNEVIKAIKPVRGTGYKSFPTDKVVFDFDIVTEDGNVYNSDDVFPKKSKREILEILRKEDTIENWAYYNFIHGPNEAWKFLDVVKNPELLNEDGLRNV